LLLPRPWSREPFRRGGRARPPVELECAMSDPSCPTPERYLRLIAGQLPSREVEALARHIEGCGSCATAVSTLAAEDSLHQDVRRAWPPPDPLVRAGAVEALIDRVCQLSPPGKGAGEATGGSEAHTPPLGATAAEPYDFL